MDPQQIARLLFRGGQTGWGGVPLSENVEDRRSADTLSALVGPQTELSLNQRDPATLAPVPVGPALMFDQDMARFFEANKKLKPTFAMSAPRDRFGTELFLNDFDTLSGIGDHGSAILGLWPHGR